MACGDPDPHFRSISPTRISVGNSDFEVFVRGNLAEALRVNSRYAPRLGPIRAEAAVAMAQVSGCKVYGVLGDQAQQTGLLDCRGNGK